MVKVAQIAPQNATVNKILAGFLAFLVRIIWVSQALMGQSSMMDETKHLEAGKQGAAGKNIIR